MNNKYNVLVNYLGDGEFKFTIKKVGEISISKSKPVYIYNANVEIVNSLRLLRRMLIEIHIGAKPTGAYKIYNIDEIDRERASFMDNRIIADRRGYAETVSNNEISSILSSGTSGPIIEDKPVTTPKVEDKPKTTKKTTRKSSGKKTSKK